jgi:peptidoglycan/LPS O-acetylase OafA/YrhL
MTIAAALAASLLAGWLLYRLVETPFMRLRERYVPSMTSKAAGMSASQAARCATRIDGS